MEFLLLICDLYLDKEKCDRNTMGWVRPQLKVISASCNVKSIKREHILGEKKSQKVI